MKPEMIVVPLGPGSPDMLTLRAAQLLQDGAYRIPTDDEEYDSFAENIKERSLQEFKTDLQTRPDIVTLSTCYGYGHQYFTVIHGALDKTFQIPATKTTK